MPSPSSQPQRLTDRGELPVAQQTAPELVQAGGREITLKDGSNAIEMHVVVSGETIRAVLSDALFNMGLYDQGIYATKVLGGGLATRAENRAVAMNLLEKEEQKTLNSAETNLLGTYREKYVRDDDGGLAVEGRRVFEFHNLVVYAHPTHGALVVLPFAESK